MTFKEFQEALKKLDTFKLRRGKKLFALVNVTRETATLTEVGSTKNMDVPTKMLYKAFKDLEVQGECTTKDLTPYVQSTAAPACAALLNSVFDVEIDEELNRVTNEIENTYQELLDLYVSDDFLFEPSGFDLEPTSYKKALGEMNPNMLEQEAFLLGAPSTIKATRASSMKKMQQDIYKFVTQHPEEWLLGLPMRDLYLLQEMVNGKLVRVDYSHTPPTLNWLRIVMDTAIDGKEGEYIAIYDDLKEVLQPLIRPTIIAKLTLAEFTLETLLVGLMNTVGWISRKKAIQILSERMRKEMGKEMGMFVNIYFEHSILTKIFTCAASWDKQGGTLCTPRLKDMPNLGKSDWVDDDRPELSFDDLMLRGLYPFIRPINAEEQDFFDLLTKKGFSEDEAFLHFTLIFHRIQEERMPNGKLLSEIIEVFPQSKLPSDKDISIITTFVNNVPRPHFNGYSPEQMASKRLRPNAHFAAANPMFNIDSPFDSGFKNPFGNLNLEQPKVGRNEPCPCGSGKKYKKCCGREN